MLYLMFSAIFSPVKAISNPFDDAVKQKYSLKRLDQCFCEVLILNDHRYVGFTCVNMLA